jgi:hypothetical protein
MTRTHTSLLGMVLLAGFGVLACTKPQASSRADQGSFTPIAQEARKGEIAEEATSEEQQEPLFEPAEVELAPETAPFPDHRRLIGMSEAQVRALYGEPKEIIRKTVATEISKVGDHSYAYSQPWGLLDIYFSGGRVNALMVGFIPPASSENQVLGRFGFPTGQRPTKSAIAGKDWTNLGGYSVRLTLEVERARATGRVNGIIIWK